MIIPKCNDTQTLLNFCSGIDKSIFKKEEQLEEVLASNKRHIIDLFYISQEGSNSDNFTSAERFIIVEKEAEQLKAISTIDSKIQEECISVPKAFRVKSTFVGPVFEQSELRKHQIQLSRKYLEFNQDIDIRAIKFENKSLLCISFFLKSIFKL